MCPILVSDIQPGLFSRCDQGRIIFLPPPPQGFSSKKEKKRKKRKKRKKEKKEISGEKREGKKRGKGK